jgi:acyl-CoA synthetase (AMP-forming)/AMP-acid ligase II
MVCDPSAMLPRVTREAARRFGDATAYVAPGGWALSYRDVDRLSDRVAAGLLGRGITAGDVVALVLPPGPEYLVAYLAVAKVGAITTGVNDKLAGGERDAILDIADPAIVLAAPELAPASDVPAVAVEPATTPDDVLRGVQDAGDVPELAPDPERSVAIIFTSGTTGLPKGALYTNRQLEFITATDVGGRWGGGARSFTGTSFAHLGFMTKLPGNLMRGGTTFIMRRWRAHDALELLARERMVTVAGVPTQLALMLADPDFDTFDLTSVGYIVVGGGPVTPGLAAEARARFGAALATRYSCTEAGIGLGTAFDDPDEDAIVSVGRPHESVDLAVLGEDDAPVGAGAIGRVCLRSPAVMAGYWRDPESTRAAFTASGHVRTGDLGWIDDRGRLRLVGRSKEMYVRGGYNVYPVEVEAVLSMHPDLRAVAVVPRPDPVMGEIGVAVVVAEGEPPTLDRLRAFAEDRLARYKLPEALAVVDALPLTAGEKLDRRALAAMLTEAPSTGR